MQLWEQFCHWRKMLHYKKELPRGISSKNLEDTMLYKLNKGYVETGKSNHQSHPTHCLVGFSVPVLDYHRLPLHRSHLGKQH